MISQHPIAHYMHAYFYECLDGTKGLSANTILSYRDSLKLFFRYAADHCHKDVDRLLLEELDHEVVVSFLNHLEAARGNSLSTRNLRLSAIRSLFKFIGGENPELLDLCHRVCSIPKKHIAHKTAVYLEDEEVTAILDAVDLNTKQGPRDHAILQFLYNSGARAQETVDLCIADIQHGEMNQVRLFGKGRRFRSCPLWPETTQALEKALQGRERDSTQALFLNARGRPMTRFGLNYLVNKYATRAQEKCPSLETKKVGPHTFRHSTAMMLLHAGNDINAIQKWLGHADINTTHAYFELDMNTKRRILEKAKPPTGSEASKKPKWKEPKVLAFLDQLTKNTLAASPN